METTNTISGVLALFPQPAFAVRDSRILCVNQGAANLMLEPDMPVADLLHAGADEYLHFSEGQLYVTLEICAKRMGATVRRMQDVDIFVLEPAESPHLQALALAARSLREPLAGAMLAADKIHAVQSDALDAEAAQLNQRLHQLLRLVGNMSDAERYLQPNRNHLELRNVTAVIDEILQKGGHLLEQAGMQIDYKPLQEDIFCPIDSELLERCIFNILSNAAKNAPSGQINIRVSRKNNILRLVFHDNGTGISTSAMATAHIGYQRQVGLENVDRGIGLGMVMIRAAAAAHDGTVLIDTPSEGGTRVTLTLRILPHKDAGFRNKLLRPDYAGERDHAMIELSEQLPAKLYK